MDFRSLYFILASIVVLNAEEQDWTKKCNKCNCIWANGKKTANCSDQNFSSIPNDLSSYIREIDFSNNPLNFLGKEEFHKANLSNIHKLKLQNCSLELVDEKAFNHLALLIELDLSRNHLEKLHSNTFHDNIKLRILILSDNKLKVLEDGLFNNMTFLQKISLDHNLITTITPNTFKDLVGLFHINLGYNRIQRIEFDLKKGLDKFNSLNVEGNPWICDCKLQEFRYSAIKNNLITTKTVCQSPSKLQGRAFQESVVFACLPKIIEPFSYSQIEASSANITLTCKVSGDPIPDVDWINGGHIIERDPRKNKQKYYTSKDTIDGYTWNNLTITNVNYRDRGDYKCIAKNPGGEDERNITLLVPLGTTGGGITGNISNNTYLIIGLSIGFIIVLLILLVVIFCFCKKSSHGLSSKRREHADSSEEYISMSGGQADIKKGLITDVNPITKPPRTTVPPSVVSGGTEVSDVKRNLLDNESVFDCDDESRSLDFDQPLLRKSQMTIDSDYRLNGHHYPPDLLPFPPRGVTQVSPAPSSTSTVADTTRLPPHHGPQSPLHSPIYDQLNLYRTLPYSRSHSPFVGPAPRVPRQGYVTIPRRPRQQSWSSEPPNVSELASVAEPLYDNLGLRTTADGGASALSLNKLDGAITTSTPRTNRMFPLSPTNCDPIAESHEASGGNVGMGTGSQTLPRNLNSTKLTPSRTQWAKANAEALRSPEKRNSTASLPPTDPQPGGKPTKVPPRPPPKPKKRLSTGPLFEDEGEDGTEV